MIQDHINGKTNIFAVIGDPIRHTFSPVIHNTVAKRLRHDIAYTPFHVTSEKLGEAICGAHALGIQGINVTIPHKKSVVEFICSMDDSARVVGTVNTLKFTSCGYVGYNTDTIGLARVFHMRGISIKNKAVAVLGAGGSAYSAAAMAAEHGAREIFIANRTRDNAEILAQHINTHYNNIGITVLSYQEMEDKKPDIIIQTSAAGFGVSEGETPVKGPDIFKNIELAVDIIYRPWETMFLHLAAQSGCPCVNGLDMLIYQALASYEIWQDMTLDENFAREVQRDLTEYYKSL